MAKVKVKDLLQKLGGNNVNYQTDMEVEENEIINSKLTRKEIEEQKLSGVQVQAFFHIGYMRTYKDGLLDGVSETFYHKGKIVIREQYKRGNWHGYVETYRPNGTLELRNYFEHGIEIENKEN